MIFIVSAIADSITNKVCEWLITWHIPFTRINTESENRAVSVLLTNKLNQFSIDIEDNQVFINENNVNWFRNGSLLSYEHRKIQGNILNREIENYFHTEIKIINDFYLKQLFNETNIGNYFIRDVNKLTVLKKAVDCGLKIPDTLVTTEKKYLLEFIEKYPSVISKPLTASENLTDNNFQYPTYTREITAEDLNLLQDIFIPSLFQQKIIPFCEIRVFFLEKRFFAMAILSNSSKRKGNNICDWRWQSKEKNRFVPFKLPNKIRACLIQLSKKLKLNTGSFDLILDNHNIYYFLEVNPVGQFDFLNEFCNYGIDKILAKKIVSKYEKRN
jgi:ATP-GRASP peptide maturase of grasp-with-spasm system